MSCSIYLLFEEPGIHTDPFTTVEMAEFAVRGCVGFCEGLIRVGFTHPGTKSLAAFHAAYVKMA